MTTDPALLAEQIQARDEVSSSNSGVTLGPETVSGSGYTPSYNVAPTAAVATVVSRHTTPDDDPTRRVRLMRWGLIPAWVKPGPNGMPESGGRLLINARADRVTTSPAFRSSAAHRRCLVPMNGFYEWRVDPATLAAGKSRKTPFYAYRSDGQLLFMAGLWSVWRNPASRSDQPLHSCAIITTDAVGDLAAVHDRMPLIIAESDWDTWLDPDAAPDPALLAGPPDVGGITVHEVSTLVNNARNNGRELIERNG